MNNMMKKMAAALLALTCIPVTGMTAAAEDPLRFSWGTVSYAAVKGMEEVPIPEVFQNNPTYYHGQRYFVKDTKTLIEVSPRRNVLRFVIRDNLDYDAVSAEVEATVKSCYADLQPGQLVQTATVFMRSNDAYDLYVDKAYENKAMLEANLLLSLARKHLISAFYGFGQTADQQPWYDTVKNRNMKFERNEEVDWDSVDAYLAEHYPSLSVVEEVNDAGKTNHYIAVNEEMDFCKRSAIIMELEATFGLWFDYGTDPTGGEITTGQNALEKKGDVTLDTDISIVDVIALNRNIMTGDPLCDTAKLNADVNGDGIPDETDALAILKEVVEITQDFQEQ